MDATRTELPRWECLELLRSNGIGRVCIIDHGYPLAIPVNYRVQGSLDDAKIVIRTAPDTLLGRYEGLTSLEVDDVDIAKGSAWSVITRGRLRRVIGEQDLSDPDPLLKQDRVRWMVIDVSALSGRRFSVRRAAESQWVEWQLTS